MRARSMVTLGTLAAGVLLARPAAGHADFKQIFVVGAVMLVLPAHVGADVPVGGDSQTRVVVGWSYQFPFSRPDTLNSPHRVVLGADLLLRGDTGGRARIGYRYSTNWLFAGAGVAAGTAGPTLSPELGVKFWHFAKGQSESLHLLVRGDIEPDLQRVRAATIVLGWNLI